MTHQRAPHEIRRRRQNPVPPRLPRHVRLGPFFNSDAADRVQCVLVTFAPGERHWHFATLTNEASHIAIHEVQNGRRDWLDPVSDADYRAEPER